MRGRSPSMRTSGAAALAASMARKPMDCRRGPSNSLAQSFGVPEGSKALAIRSMPSGTTRCVPSHLHGRNDLSDPSTHPRCVDAGTNGFLSSSLTRSLIRLRTRGAFADVMAAPMDARVSRMRSSESRSRLSNVRATNSPAMFSMATVV